MRLPCLPPPCHCSFRTGTQPGDQKERPGLWIPKEEARDRKANQPEGGMPLKTSWRCGPLRWGLKEDEELSREREEADFQVGRRTRTNAEP